MLGYFQHWVGFLDPPEEIYGTPSSQRNVSFNLEEDDEQSPQTVEDPSPSQQPIPRMLGQNKARKRSKGPRKGMPRPLGVKLFLPCKLL